MKSFDVFAILMMSNLILMVFSLSKQLFWCWVAIIGLTLLWGVQDQVSKKNLLLNDIFYKNEAWVIALLLSLHLQWF